MDLTDVAIRTPDQRLRVFVSSTLQELAQEREAARRGIGLLRLTPVMFELGARPYPPRDLYRAYIDQSDIFVGVYWQRYGWIAPGMDISGLDDEYRLAREKPMLIYVREPAPEREERLKRLIRDIRDAGGISYRSFTSPRELQELLADDLAVLVTERFHREPPSAPEGHHEAAGLPSSLTSFVGRERELESVCGLLTDEDIRLVTLTGMGGIGKTRLALEAGMAAASQYEDGVLLVALDKVDDAGMVEQVIVQALGLRPSGSLSSYEVIVDYLHDKRLLLILDNLEHVISAAPSIAAIAARCPRATILCTSRAPLRVHGEHEFHVPPLELPRDDTQEDLLESDAVNLFVDRARAVLPSFSISTENAAAVASICRQLDGLPLAIELAASRIRLVPPEALKERLTSHLDGLRSTYRDSPERQRTLRAVVTWSYELLSDVEKRLLAELSIFEGTFSLEAAEYVCGIEDMRVLDVIDSLLDSSLITPASEGGEPRFRMFTVVRDFAAEFLAGLQKTDLLERRHADHYRDVVVASYSGLRGSQQRDWLTRLERDHPNLRKALRHLLDLRRVEDVATMMWALWPYWWFRSRTAEGRRWIAEALEVPDGKGALAQGRLKGSEGVLALVEGDMEAATLALTEANSLFRDLDQAIGIAWTVTFRALSRVFTGATSEGRRELAEARDLFREEDEEWGEILSINALCWADVGLGEIRDMTTYVDALERAERLGDDVSIAMALHNLSEASLLQDKSEDARRYLVRALKLLHELGFQNVLANTLDTAGRLAMSCGSHQRAIVLFAAGQSLREKAGFLLWPGARTRHDADVERTRKVLGTRDFETAWREGSALDVDAATAAALTYLETLPLSP